MLVPGEPGHSLGRRVGWGAPWGKNDTGERARLAEEEG